LADCERKVASMAVSTLGWNLCIGHEFVL